MPHPTPQSSDRTGKLERAQCEEGPCSEWGPDERPNCVLRCQSESCYTAIYGAQELEPGEVDTARNRLYQTCLTKERGERLRAEARAKRGR